VDLNFRPYTKADQLKSHKKKKKKPETFKGRTIPGKKTRGKITSTEYKRAIEEHGYICLVCGTTINLECHHVVPKGFSRIKNGRGVWRNLRFLCSEHHRGKTGVHQNKQLMDYLQSEHESLYGPNFYKDRFDLFKEGLILNSTKESYEDFMRKESEKCRLQRNLAADVKK
jgi:5-methylcytosine-specific restriction endonuclease McrA